MFKYQFLFISALFLSASCGNINSVNESLQYSDELVEDLVIKPLKPIDVNYYVEPEYNEPKVREIYNPANTILTDLIHTKLQVSFNWEKSQLNGIATITAKPHFYASDKLIS